jgi:RNA polymerase sigma-70 factor (ECF subfamily)
MSERDPPGPAERIRHGDKAAFEALFRAHYEALCRFATRYVDSVEAAEDLVQEVFFDLWKRRHAWRPEAGPRAFLYGAVRNQGLKHQRWLRVREGVQGHDALADVAGPQDPARTLQDRESLRTARQLIRELPPRRRSVFLLSRRHGLTYDEIATALDISVKTVETHMGRALKTLREHFSAKQQPLLSSH